MSADQLYATIIADSVPEYGCRLTTMEVTMHRFVLAEFNTHRAFSRNSASSRAIPFSKMVARVKETPAIPLAFPGEQKGMSGNETIEIEGARERWLEARDYAVAMAEELAEMGVHKSVVNRLIEPWLIHKVIVTSTDWENFFAQRCTPQAQPEIRATAELMQQALADSTPRRLKWGEFHLPFHGLNMDDMTLSPIEQLKVSTARCARVSYLTHDGERDVQADLKLYDDTLAKWGHWSPLEHIATPLHYGPFHQQGNLSMPWMQFRHLVEVFGKGTSSAAEFVLATGTHPEVGMFTHKETS